MADNKKRSHNLRMQVGSSYFVDIMLNNASHQ